MAGSSNSSSFWGGLLLGTAIGTVCGLLFAPSSGRETRRILRNSLDSLPNVTEDKVDSFQMQTNRFLSQARGRMDETMNRLQEAIEAGKQATYEYRKRPDYDNGRGPSVAKE